MTTCGKILFFCAVSGVLAYGQQAHIPSGSTGAPKTTSEGSTDTGPNVNLQVKSNNQVLQENPQLSAKLQVLLPTEITPQQACSDFKTLEQCITTIHAAHDLNISFSDLKAKTTGKHSTGLEKAVQQTSTGVNSKDAVKKAKKAASEDMKGISLFGS